MQKMTTLETIRRLFKVPAYDQVKIRTQEGEIGVIVGVDGVKLKVFFQEINEEKSLHPEDLIYLGFTVKEKTD